MAKHNIEPAEEPREPIRKPNAFDLNKFRSRRPEAAGVEISIGVLPVHSLKEAGDWIRLHEDRDNYWSPELCFVNVPIKGQVNETLHLIEEELALRFLPSGKIIRHRLALASKPYDVFFLAKVPSRNLENTWQQSALQGCEQASTHWVEITSRKSEGVDSYRITSAPDSDAFLEPKWPTQSLGELIASTFLGRIIDHEDHAGLLRLRGMRQKT